MQTHIEVNILPALAFYQVLVDDGLSDEMAQEHLRRFYGQKTRVENKLKTSVFHWLPRRFGFRLLRWITRRSMNQTFNEPGFSFTWLENTPDKIAFYMTRCLYYNVLTAYGAAQLTPIFCELDDVMFGMMEPAIHFVRTGTIGRGSSVCDFCWMIGQN